MAAPHAALRDRYENNPEWRASKAESNAAAQVTGETTAALKLRTPRRDVVRQVEKMRKHLDNNPAGSLVAALVLQHRECSQERACDEHRSIAPLLMLSSAASGQGVHTAADVKKLAAPCGRASR